MNENRWDEGEFRTAVAKAQEQGGTVNVQVDVGDKDHDEMSDHLGRLNFSLKDGGSCLDGSAQWHDLIDSKGNKTAGQVKLRLVRSITSNQDNL